MQEQVYYRSIFNTEKRVHIADPSADRCEHLCMLFRLEGFQVSFSLDAAQFDLALERGRVPDIAIINLDMGDTSGLSSLKKLRQLRTGALAIMTTTTPKVDATVMAMKLGAADVLQFPLDNEELLATVRDAMRRDVLMGATKGGGRSIEVVGFSKLTPREREVLELIANGLSNKSAAQDLAISHRTVEVHRARIMVKLGARNTADLMRIVLTM